MRRMRYLVGAAMGLLVAFGAEAKTIQGVSDGEILIGALGALTGATAFIGAPGRDGIQLAIDKINEAGGVNGRKLRLVFEHAFTPAESVAAAKKLVEEDKVFVLVLASGSTGAAAAADYVRETGVPTYNIFGATPIIREPFAKNIFHSSIPAASASGKALADRVLEVAPGAKKIGILAGTYAFPQASLKEVKPILERAGVQVVLEQFEQGSRDFTAPLVAFARQRVPAVMILGSYPEAGFAIQQAPEKGLTDVAWVLDATAVNDAITQIIGPENSKRIYGYCNQPYYPGQQAEPIAKFREMWTAKYGPPPQGRPATYDIVGYGSTYVLAQAIKAAGTDLSWEGLIEAWSHLKDAKPSGLGGVDVIFPETFTETDHQGNHTIGKGQLINGHWQVLK